MKKNIFFIVIGILTFFISHALMPVNSMSIRSNTNMLYQAPETDNTQVLFKEDFENSSGWQFTNGASANKWHIGSATANPQGGKSLYISNDNGISNAYTEDMQTVTHAYKTISIAQGVVDVTLSFDWKFRSSWTNGFRIWIVPNNFTPEYGQRITASNERILFKRLNTTSLTWENFAGILNLENFAGSEIKIIIEWTNNGFQSFFSNQPPAAIDNIQITKNNCSRVHSLVVNNTSVNAATLSWTAPNTTNNQNFSYYYSTEEELPENVTPSSTVTAPTVTLNNLASSTVYYFWVKNNCTSSDGSSDWVGPIMFITPAENTTCNSATTLKVNPSVECIDSAQGLVSKNNQGNLPTVSCTTATVIDEVWYDFTATKTTHFIKYKNKGWVTGVYLTVYSENICNTTSEELICSSVNNNSLVVVNNLIVGNKYKIRISNTDENWNNFTSFNICVLTPENYIKTSTNEFTNEELVKDILIKNECAEIDNISWKTGTNYNDDNTNPDSVNPNGIGYFNQNASKFPFKDGIILSTGDVLKAPGPKYTTRSSGNENWLGDQDLKEIIAPFNPRPDTELLNASLLEFDFKAITNKISFNFIFASDEYGSFQCGFSDAFAFILTDLETNEKKNLAVVPNTNIPVSVTTIRNKEFNEDCESENEQYFSKYTDNGTDASALSATINFRGFTIPLTAQSEVVPGRKYHIKLVIADSRDSSNDSAVFLEGGSFDIGKIDFGDDKLIKNKTALCSEESLELDTKLSAEFFDFQWFKDNVLIEAENNPKYTATQSGTFVVKAQVKGSDCFISDTIKIEKRAPINLQKVTNPEICTLKNIIPQIDLTTIENELLSGLENKKNFTVTYYKSQEDAQEEKNPIENKRNFLPNTLPTKIFVRVKDKEFGCFSVTSFDLIKKDTEQINKLNDIFSCVFDDEISPVSFKSIENELKNRINTNTSLTYHLTQNNALMLENPIENTNEYVATRLPQTIFVSIVDKTNGCQAIGKFQIKESPKIDLIAPEDIISCNAYLLAPLEENHYYSTEKFGKGKRLHPGEKLLEGKHTVYINIENELGCVFSKKQEIEVIDCSIPKGISPNGDGLNDNLDLTNYHPLSVSIFNRQGKEVYSHNQGYTNQWQGQSQSGQKLPDGTYFYKVITQTEELTGYIELLR